MTLIAVENRTWGISSLMHSVFILWSIQQSFINHPWMVMSVFMSVLIIQYWSIFMWKHPTVPGRQSLSICVGQLQDESQAKRLAQNVPACRFKQEASNRPMQQLMHHPSSFIITVCSSAYSVMGRLGPVENVKIAEKLGQTLSSKCLQMSKWIWNTKYVQMGDKFKEKHWLRFTVKAFCWPALAPLVP